MWAGAAPAQMRARGPRTRACAPRPPAGGSGRASPAQEQPWVHPVGVEQGAGKTWFPQPLPSGRMWAGAAPAQMRARGSRTRTCAPRPPAGGSGRATPAQEQPWVHPVGVEQGSGETRFPQTLSSGRMWAGAAPAQMRAGGPRTRTCAPRPPAGGSGRASPAQEQPWVHPVGVEQGSGKTRFPQPLSSGRMWAGAAPAQMRARGSRTPGPAPLARPRAGPGGRRPPRNNPGFIPLVWSRGLGKPGFPSPSPAGGCGRAPPPRGCGPAAHAPGPVPLARPRAGPGGLRPPRNNFVLMPSVCGFAAQTAEGSRAAVRCDTPERTPPDGARYLRAFR